MKYLKNFILASREVFIVFIIQYVILIFSAIIFKFNEDYIILYGTILLLIFEIFYIIYIIRKRKVKLKFKYKYFPYMLMGIGINTVFNMFRLKISGEMDIPSDVSLYIILLSSGIIGPIFEEFLFRYSYIRKLKKFNSSFGCIIISTLVFALLHNNIYNILYALILGSVNAYFYIKKEDILIPIIIHVAGNIIANFFYEFNYIVLILGICLLIISILIKHSDKE